jgi:Glycosyl transferases group 1.
VKNEPFGLVIVEAMAYGVLPIAHKSGGPSEILPREFLYSDEKDAEELIKKYMVEYNEKIYNEMRQRAREFTKDKVEHKLYQAITETFGQ